MRLSHRNPRPDRQARLRAAAGRLLATAGVAALAAGLLTVVTPAPALASISQVCRVQIFFEIGPDDLRSNTIVRIAAGGQSFTVPGGISANSVASRTGAFPVCIPHSALLSGFTITSISTPTWPDTTDNWDLDGVAFMDPDTGRMYLRRPGTTGLRIKRFTGSAPSWTSDSISVSPSAPFLDHRYADCDVDAAFVRFVDPLHLTNPTFNVIIRIPGTTAPTVTGRFFGDPYFDWGGVVTPLGITDPSNASMEFVGTTPDGRVARGFIQRGCDPIALRA
ncbi:hypothetical protein V6U90_11125 [Micromonospora sp. CPCC 206060]|uniref:hypothetical protein n=1 Tax=Micromonospora sp. CPCC 206060 TaxID=3122406 RepID=UPI002FF1D6EF